jgi:hypothetical protein
MVTKHNLNKIVAILIIAIVFLTTKTPITFAEIVPTLTSLTNNTTLNKPDIAITWNSVPDASNYVYAVRDLTNNNLITNGTTSQMIFVIPSAMLVGEHQFRLYIASVNSCGTVCGNIYYFAISNSSSSQPILISWEQIARDNWLKNKAYLPTLIVNKYGEELANLSLVSGETNGVNTTLLKRLALVASAYRTSIYINSGYRTPEEQENIILKNLAKPGYWGSLQLGAYLGNNQMVAPKYESRHLFGIAADVNKLVQSLSNATLANYGLIKPLSFEPWHVETIETSSGMRG